MLAHSKTGDVVIRIGYQIRAFWEGGHVQAGEVIGIVQAFAAALGDGFNGRYCVCMQGQRQTQCGCGGLAGMVVGRATDAAGDKSRNAIGKAAF